MSSFKKQKKKYLKKYLGGYSISLMSRPDVYVLGSSSLLGEAEELLMMGWRFPMVYPLGPSVVLPSPASPGDPVPSSSLPVGPMGTDRPGTGCKVTLAIATMPSTLLALNKW